MENQIDSKKIKDAKDQIRTIRFKLDELEEIIDPGGADRAIDAFIKQHEGENNGQNSTGNN